MKRGTDVRTLYLDCETGISGDMIVAALMDLGADKGAVEKALSGVEGVGIAVSRKIRGGIDCCDFEVILDKEHENHDHDMRYLYGHTDNSADTHDIGGDHQHPAVGHIHGGDEGACGHFGHEGAHGHRTLKEVEEILESLDMTPGAEKLARKIFRILGEAEAKAHGKSVGEVHFHEVGALDSIADIVAASVCFDDLGITDVIIPRLCEGSGTVRTQHGILPVPVPAVMHIAKEHGLPISVTGRMGELITPTGAAFAAATMTGTGLPKVFNIKACGYGAGKREYEIPSILRAVIIEPGQSEEGSVIVKLETNIDDTTGESLGYVMERLMGSGAKDVYYTPVFMKKNRPAYMLSVLASEDKVSELESIIFSETTTIGIRRTLMERSILPRREETIKTPYGDARAKVCTHGEEKYVYPEYESAALIAKTSGMSLKDAYDLIRKAYVKKDDAVV